MRPFVTAGAGFLLAVLWFDLMFDVQALRHRGRDVPENVLASIAGYYARVTTAARPMNRLVAAVMLGTAGSVIAQVARGERPLWVGWTSLGLIGVPVLIATTRTVPGAVRLGARSDDDTHIQAKLAISIGREHVACAVAIVALLAVQLAYA